MTRSRLTRILAAAVAMAGFAACSKGTPAEDATLKRDLDLASGQGLELAPKSGSTAILSADELVPTGNKTKAVVHVSTPARHVQPETPAPAKMAQTPAPRPSPAKHDSVVAAAPATQRPLPASSVSAPPPGGYKTMGELIRKAPFPINP